MADAGRMGAGRDGEVNRRLIIQPGAIGDPIVTDDQKTSAALKAR